jgi:hypothetical protein
VYFPSTVKEAFSNGIFPRTNCKAVLSLQHAAEYALRSGVSFSHARGALETADGKAADDAAVTVAAAAAAARKSTAKHNGESARDKLKGTWTRQLFVLVILVLTRAS